MNYEGGYLDSYFLGARPLGCRSARFSYGASQFPHAPYYAAFCSLKAALLDSYFIFFFFRGRGRPRPCLLCFMN